MSRLLVVGASARAAAASACRAGFQPWCADLFCDTDLRGIVPDAVRCRADRYPDGLAAILRDAPDGPWIYTGGLENHPRLIGRMSAIRPLWGNGPAALRLCRDPFTIQRILGDAGLPVVRVRKAGTALPGPCRWLQKPVRGAAGQGIAFADSAPESRQALHYYQEFVDGQPMSAIYVRANGSVKLLGVTEQLIGLEWLNAPSFRYCGNIGPAEITEGMRADLVRIGQHLGDGCGLTGLFGIDFIACDGRPWVVEVNPRYPASVEVLELSMGIAALGLLRTGFDPAAEPVQVAQPRPSLVGKAVVYAARRLVAPRLGTANGSDPIDPFSRATLPNAIARADIPQAGEWIEAGWPVLTILAAGRSRESVVHLLLSEAESICRQIHDSPG